MAALIDLIIFTGALATSIAVIALMVAPQWRRIVSLASGHREAMCAPLAVLAAAERRIAVGRWAAQPAPAAFSRVREAA